MADRAQLDTTPQALNLFALAGDAILTLHNKEKNSHVTLWLRRPKGGERGRPGPLFVKIMTGSKPEDSSRSNYAYVGCVWTHDRDGKVQRPNFRYGGPKAKLAEHDPRVRAASWLVDAINGQIQVPDHIEIHHEGRCCFCRKELTQPESVRHGYGPDCAAMRALPYGKSSIPTKPGEEPAPVPQAVDPLTIPCPRRTCGAAIHENCRTRAGGRQSRPHKARVEAARRKRDIPQPNPSPAPGPAPRLPQPNPSPALESLKIDTEGRSYDRPAGEDDQGLGEDDQECLCGERIVLGQKQCLTCKTSWVLVKV